MTDIDTEEGEGLRWRVPEWYRRVGMISLWFLLICAAIALLAVLIAATADITVPLILGAFLAVVFAPLVDRLARLRLPRSLAAIAVLAGLVAMIVAVGWLTGAALVDQSDQLSANLDTAVADIRSWFDDTPVNDELVDRIRDTAGDAGRSLTHGVAGRVVSVVDSAFGILTGAILGIIVLYYLLKDGADLAHRSFEREHDPERRAMLERLGDRTVSNVRSYFAGRTAMAVVNGAGIGVAAALLGVPAATAIGVVNFFGSYIPYLGAFIGGAFAVLMALGEGGIGLALVVLGITLAVNLLLENLLEPVLIGDSLDLHPLLVLLVTALGGLIAGLLGLILAAPAVAIALDLQRELRSAGFFDED